MRRCELRGQRPLLAGETPGTSARYAYMDIVAEYGHVWAVEEANAPFEAMMAGLAAAAVDWDGSDPFRS